MKQNKPIPATLAPLLQAAFNHHQAGRLNDAERGYREVLRQVPKNFDVLHLLGILCAQQGDAEQAVLLIGQAVKINPREPLALMNLGGAQRQMHQYNQALASFERALQLKSNYPEAYIGRGNVLQDLGRYQEALTSYERALTQRPGHPEALNNQSAALLSQQCFDEALHLFCRVDKR